jgi:hypothetical protein
LIVLRYTHLPLDSPVCRTKFFAGTPPGRRREAVVPPLEDRGAHDYDFEKAKFLSG